MSKPFPTDVRGRAIGVGDFVCYTTNAEGSALQFGIIEKVVEKEVDRYHYDPVTTARTKYTDLTFKVIVWKTDVNANPVYDYDWDPVTSQRVLTDRQLKSGRIDHHSSKFMKL